MAPTSENLTQLLTILDAFPKTPPTSNNPVDGIINQIRDIVSAVVTQLMKQYIDPISGNVANAVNGVIGGIKNTINNISNTVNGITSSINQSLGYAISSIGQTVDEVKSTVTSSVNGAISDIGRAIDSTKNAVIDSVNSTLGGIGATIGDAINGIKDTLNGITTSISNLAGSIAQGITNSVNGIIGGVKDWLVTQYDSVTQSIGNTINAVSDWLKTTQGNIVNAVNGAIKGIGDILGGLVQGAEKTVQDAIDGIKQKISDIQQSLHSSFASALEWLSNLIMQIHDFIWKQINVAASYLQQNFLPFWARAVDWAQKVTGLSEVDWNKIREGDFSSLGNGIDNVLLYGEKAAQNSPLFTFFYALKYFWNEVDLQFIPINTAAARQAEINLGLSPLDLSQAGNAVLRGIWKADDFIENARIAGMNESRAAVALQLTRQLMPIDVLQQAYLRKQISEEDHDRILASYGFDPTEITQIKKIYQNIPSIHDLIQMADRWAFDDTVAQRFEYDTEFPDDIDKFVNEIGFSHDWFIKYWRAHWQLPSLQDVFRMFQRLRPGTGNVTFSEDDLKAYLRTTPYPPYFHDKMTAIAYEPFTRVDIRRMFKVGILTQDQLQGAYQDIGYSPENAKIMVDFTLKYSPPEDQTVQDGFKELARATYSTAYKDNIISEDEYRHFLTALHYQPSDVDLLVSVDQYVTLKADKLFKIQDYRKAQLKVVLDGYSSGLLSSGDTTQMLLDMGYEADEAQLEINLIDYNRELETHSILLNQLHDQYVQFIIDDTGLINTLNTFNFMPGEIDNIMQQWQIERTFRTRKPTLAELVKWLKDGLMDGNTFLDEIRGLGYDEKYVQYFAIQYLGNQG